MNREFFITERESSTSKYHSSQDLKENEPQNSYSCPQQNTIVYEKQDTLNNMEDIEKDNAADIKNTKSLATVVTAPWKQTDTISALAGSGLGRSDLVTVEVDSRSNIDKDRKFESMQDTSDLNTISSALTVSQLHKDTIGFPIDIVPFKPAKACSDASDFKVRCFVVRLRQGIEVIKHGRNTKSASSPRLLKLHPDGRSLTWSQIENGKGLKSSFIRSKQKVPKMDLMECSEVRHSWTTDPSNERYTGTSILRTKCNPNDAFKSFSLIFPSRTLDFTATTSDQCIMLMQGFSALCFRLQLAAIPEHLRMDAKEKVSTKTDSTVDLGDEDTFYTESTEILQSLKESKKQYSRMCLGVGLRSWTSCIPSSIRKIPKKSKNKDDIEKLAPKIIITNTGENSELDGTWGVTPIDEIFPAKNDFDKQESAETPSTLYSCSACEFLFGN